MYPSMSFLEIKKMILRKDKVNPNIPRSEISLSRTTTSLLEADISSLTVILNSLGTSI